MILRLMITQERFEINDKPIVNVIDPYIRGVTLLFQEFLQIAGNCIMLNGAPGYCR